MCISQTTKNTLLKHVIPKSYSVIYDPISIIFKRNFKEFNQIKPVILHIGTNWNKNLAGVIIALRDISCTLRIIGKIEQKDIALLQENGINWSQAENLSDQEILEEYINCDMVSFPSIYEGFGMPIIEGQAVGRVVLTSKIDPMPEIGGADSAYYVNPADVNEIRNGFLCLINDAALRERLVENGFENSKRFSLDIILQEYMDIYNRYSDHS
ncbi:hypothetical protein FACS1894142_7570 [Spirochaetia bacterium]|nr:hypothetical protein FACS1894142_7570 [Spirochaetia bacterium]